jgi:hypothetical protein
LQRFSQGRARQFGAVTGVLHSVLEMIETRGHLSSRSDRSRHRIIPQRTLGRLQDGDGIVPALLAQFHPLEEALVAMGVAVWPMVELEADDASPPPPISPRATRRWRRSASGPPTRTSRSASRTTCSPGGSQGQEDLQRGGSADQVRRPPALIPDYLALIGDSADGYPGYPRHRPRYRRPSAESLRQDRRLPSHRPGRPARLALLFKQLAILRTDAALFQSVEELRWRGPTAAFPELATRLGDPKLVERCRKAQEKLSAEDAKAGTGNGEPGTGSIEN